MKRKIFLVVGLGVLGQSVAKTLAEEGAEVIAIDSELYLVDKIKDYVDVAIQVDATDPEALKQIGVSKVDAAVVCIGEKFEANIVTTANLLDLNVKHVKARASNPLTESILKRLGAHEIFYVESAMGRVIAHRMNQPEVAHEMDIGEGYRIVQLEVHENILGKTLSELALPTHYHVQIIAIRNEKDPKKLKFPDGHTVIEPYDLLLVSGHEKDLTKVIEKWKTH